jgi:hypothetical protein
MWQYTIKMYFKTSGVRAWAKLNCPLYLARTITYHVSTSKKGGEFLSDLIYYLLLQKDFADFVLSVLYSAEPMVSGVSLRIKCTAFVQQLTIYESVGLAIQGILLSQPRECKAICKTVKPYCYVNDFSLLNL